MNFEELVKFLESDISFDKKCKILMQSKKNNETFELTLDNFFNNGADDFKYTFDLDSLAFITTILNPKSTLKFFPCPNFANCVKVIMIYLLYLILKEKGPPEN